jgi:hypothetical protein
LDRFAMRSLRSSLGFRIAVSRAFQNLSLHHSTLNRKLLFPKSQKILSAPHSTF